MKKCAAISDLHGNFCLVDENLDYLFIAGDIVPLDIQNSFSLCLGWFIDKFIPWCLRTKAKKIILVGGNHDKFMENKRVTIKDILSKISPNIIYLENEFYEDDKIVVFGTPYCKRFGNWSFMNDPDKLDKQWRYVDYPEDNRYKILLTHDAPFGTSDVLLQSDCLWANGNHIGNSAITNLITRLNPDINIHGHLHSTNHEVELLNNTKVVCVSILDENYKKKFDPFYFNIE